MNFINKTEQEILAPFWFSLSNIPNYSPHWTLLNSIFFSKVYSLYSLPVNVKLHKKGFLQQLRTASYYKIHLLTLLTETLTSFLLSISSHYKMRMVRNKEAPHDTFLEILWSYFEPNQRGDKIPHIKIVRLCYSFCLLELGKHIHIN